MDLGKSRYRVNSIKMRKNVYRLLGILIMAMFSFAPLDAYELTVGVVAEGGLYGDIVNGERPPLVIHRIASPFMSYRIGSGDRAGR